MAEALFSSVIDKKNTSYVFYFLVKKKENVILHNIRSKSKIPFARLKRFKQIKRKLNILDFLSHLQRRLN